MSAAGPLLWLVSKMPQHCIRYSIDIVRIISKEVPLVPNKVHYSIYIHFVDLQHIFMCPPSHSMSIEPLQDTHAESVEAFAELGRDFCSRDPSRWLVESREPVNRTCYIRNVHLPTFIETPSRFNDYALVQVLTEQTILGNTESTIRRRQVLV